jgi:hypothetical protein
MEIHIVKKFISVLLLSASLFAQLTSRSHRLAKPKVAKLSVAKTHVKVVKPKAERKVKLPKQKKTKLGQ